MSIPPGNPDIILVWPFDRELQDPIPVAGYSLRGLPPDRDSWWIDVHRKAIPSFQVADLERWLKRYRSLSLPGGILMATEDATGEPVATAGSLADPNRKLFPDGGQIGWVATIPAHRGLGLAGWLCALATRSLLREGFRQVFVSTGDDMPTAIRVYLRLGYVPCIYASDQLDRWRRICEVTGTPYEPDSWISSEEYEAG